MMSTLNWTFGRRGELVGGEPGTERPDVRGSGRQGLAKEIVLCSAPMARTCREKKDWVTWDSAPCCYTHRTKHQLTTVQDMPFHFTDRSELTTHFQERPSKKWREKKCESVKGGGYGKDMVGLIWSTIPKVLNCDFELRTPACCVKSRDGPNMLGGHERCMNPDRAYSSPQGRPPSGNFRFVDSVRNDGRPTRPTVGLHLT